MCHILSQVIISAMLSIQAVPASKPLKTGNKFLSIFLSSRPRWLSRMRVQLEIMRLRARSLPGPAIFFRRDKSWNIFYGQSLSSAESRMAVVSFYFGERMCTSIGKPLRGIRLARKMCG